MNISIFDWSIFNISWFIYYEQLKYSGSTKSIADVNLFINTKCYKYLSGNKN